METRPRNRNSLIFQGAMILALTFGVYGQVGSFDFTNYDDHFYVTENQAVQQGITVAALRWVLTDTSQGAWQPITWLSHMLDCQLYGLAPGGHHFTSVLIHGANALLLGYALMSLTGAAWRSWLVAVLFAIHPLHVESVAWIAERRDVLSGFWFMLTLLGYSRWVASRGYRNAALVAGCFAAALLSKPIVVTLPIILLCLDFWPLARLRYQPFRDNERGTSRNIVTILVEKLPLVVLAALIGVATIIAEEGQGNLGTLDSYPMTFRLANAVLAYVRYLGKAFWPSHLLPFYPYAPMSGWDVGGALVFLIMITLGCLRVRRTHPYLLCGWLWYLVMLLPVIGIIQQGEFSIADRYTYLPLIGIFIAVVWGGEAVLSRIAWWQGKWTVVMVGCLIAVLSGMAARQISFWRDTPTLFAHTLEVDPGNFKALLQLGAYYRDQGAFAEASAYYLRVLAQLPDNREALANLGDVYDKMGRTDDAERYFRKALAIDPDYVQVYINLGIVKARQGRFAEAVDDFAKALSLRPGDEKIKINLGGALFLQGQLDAAGEQFASVLVSQPSSADAHNGLGLVLMAEGRYAEAAQHFREALTIKPDFQRAKDNLTEATAKMRGGY